MLIVSLEEREDTFRKLYPNAQPTLGEHRPNIGLENEADGHSQEVGGCSRARSLSPIEHKRTSGNTSRRPLSLHGGGA